MADIAATLASSPPGGGGRGRGPAALSDAGPSSPLRPRQLRTLGGITGHADKVCCVAFSPDGTSLATGSLDCTVRTWGSATGDELRSLVGHAGPITATAVSPDRRMMATASADKTVKVWSTSTGELLRTLEGHKAAVVGIAWSDDGKSLAASARGTLMAAATVLVWDVATGEVIRRWKKKKRRRRDPDRSQVRDLLFERPPHSLHPRLPPPPQVLRSHEKRAITADVFEDLPKPPAGGAATSDQEAADDFLPPLDRSGPKAVHCRCDRGERLVELPEASAVESSTSPPPPAHSLPISGPGGSTSAASAAASSSSSSSALVAANPTAGAAGRHLGPHGLQRRLYLRAGLSPISATCCANAGAVGSLHDASASSASSRRSGGSTRAGLQLQVQEGPGGRPACLLVACAEGPVITFSALGLAKEAAQQAIAAQLLQMQVAMMGASAGSIGTASTTAMAATGASGRAALPSHAAQGAAAAAAVASEPELQLFLFHADRD